MDRPANASPPAAPSASAAPIPLIDTARQYAEIKEELRIAIDRVCESGRFVLGPDCAELERNVADYCGAEAAVGCASGSDALLLALMACDIGPGDEVIVPSYTFFATASAVWRLGATPVFVDIDPRTYNLDPELIPSRITQATRAIIPVHLYGQCADMDAINRYAQTYGLAVIEDAAQAIGAEYHGRRAGSLGDIGTFSFYPTKNLGACGDAGMLTSNRADLVDKLRMLHVHGMRRRYYHEVIGINSRLDSLQAAVLNVKLPHLERWTEARRENARIYAELFRRCGLDEVLGLPQEASGRRHVWNQYVIRVPGGRRDALREHLAQHQIGSEIYYPVPLHLQECFQSLKWEQGSLPETERAAAETLALPIFPELTRDEQTQVVAAVAAFFGVDLPRPAQTLGGPKFLKAQAERRVQP